MTSEISEKYVVDPHGISTDNRCRHKTTAVRSSKSDPNTLALLSYLRSDPVYSSGDTIHQLLVGRTKLLFKCAQQ